MNIYTSVRNINAARSPALQCRIPATVDACSRKKVKVISGKACEVSLDWVMVG